MSARDASASAGAHPVAVHPLQQYSHASVCSCSREILPDPGGDILIVRVAGEVDLLTYPAVAAALTEGVAAKPAHLIVDVAGVGFCCARGLGLFVVETALAAAGEGIGYVLTGLPRQLERLCSVVWAPDFLPVRYPSAARAVSAIRRSAPAPDAAREAGPPDSRPGMWGSRPAELPTPTAEGW